MFSNQEFQRLVGVPVSHIYTLRHSADYRKVRVRVEHTRSCPNSICERRKPDRKGRPGYLRVDTVHQGNHDGQPGLHHKLRLWEKG